MRARSCSTWLPEVRSVSLLFFFNDTATTEIYTLSLHDALPISARCPVAACGPPGRSASARSRRDRKSTRLNSSHQIISYAVFCLKKKKSGLHPAIHPPAGDSRHGALTPRTADLIAGLRRRPPPSRRCSVRFFFNDTATTEIYTLSLHDALPICRPARPGQGLGPPGAALTQEAVCS